jgi:hypothetical protein
MATVDRADTKNLAFGSHCSKSKLKKLAETVKLTMQKNDKTIKDDSSAAFISLFIFITEYH